MKGNLLRYIGNLLRLSAFLVLMGRAYQHFFFSLPYETFFISKAPSPWNFFFYRLFNSTQTPAFINPDIFLPIFSYFVGALFFFTAIWLYWPIFNDFITHFFLILSACFLFFLSFCYYIDKGFFIGQWVEYTSQTLAPILLVVFRRSISLDKLLLLLKCSIACTFIGHGLFAIGLHPVPDHYLYMVSMNLGVNSEQAIDLLFIAGVMDMVTAVAIFLPRLSSWFLPYALWWGLLTSLARLTTAFWEHGVSLLPFHEALYQFLFRAPHFLFPLIAILLIQYLSQDKHAQAVEIDQIIHSD